MDRQSSIVKFNTGRQFATNNQTGAVIPKKERVTMEMVIEALEGLVNTYFKKVVGVDVNYKVPK
jgi:hypothetical protein